MLKNKVLLAIIIVVVIILYLLFRSLLLPMMKVATGYTAKYVCSATFVSGINEKVIQQDLDLFPVNKVSYLINKKEKYVEGSLFGFARQRAWFRKTEQGCGCTVSDEKLSYDESLPDIPRRTYLPEDTVYWPQGDLVRDTIFSNVDHARLKEVIDRTLEVNRATRAITVSYNNYLIAEGYAEGIDQDTRLLGWSMTKTMSNALIGNMVKNGMATVDMPAGIPTWQQDERRQITLGNLLQMSSGLDWEEDYGKLSNVTRMLYLEPDFYAYSIRSGLRSAPDSEWVYSSGTTNILSGFIRAQFDTEKEYLDFPYDSLFGVLGMKSAVLETDQANNYVFSSYCWATVRDWTRFGLLYLNNGMWFGKQVFTPEWTRYSVTPAASSGGEYGAQIWLNAGRKEMSSAPPDAFYEDGFGGQRVLIIPSRDLVIVMLSGQQKDFVFDDFLADVLACFSE